MLLVSIKQGLATNPIAQAHLHRLWSCQPHPYSTDDPWMLSKDGEFLLFKGAKNWREIWASSPQHQHAAKIDLRLPAASFLKLMREVSKLQASTIFQLRSKHVPLCQYLHRIGKADSPLCEMCGREEETVLFDCPAHNHARFKLGRQLG